MSGEKQFGPYRLIRQVAVGGMAEIHLAKTRGIAGFEKYVAIKMIHPNFSQDENFIEMLIDEAKISVMLQHGNIAQTFDLGRVGTTYYITMEYVDGADLYKILRKASEQDIEMPMDVAAFVAKEMSNGLDYAHRRRSVDGRPLGIVHRDVSPQNVLISHTGEVKLVDFGIAKATMKARQTAVGVIKGKYYYMSPEQAWGDPVDHRTDIFSMGILLYEALTGQMLYLEEDLHRLLDMVRKANILPPTRLRRDIPPQLEKIVMHALKKRREDRYQTAGDMASDLERFLHVYSPVFRASKVAEFLGRVLAEEPPPPTAEMPAQEILVQAPPSTISGRIADQELLRERSELRDENSVIFRIADMQKSGHGAGSGRSPATGNRQRGADQSTRPIPPMAAQESARPALGADLANIEERTMISGPPGFTGATQVSSMPPSKAILDGRFTATMDDVPEELDFGDGEADMDSAPTLTQPSKEELAVLAEARIRATAPAQRKAQRKPAHPALAAFTPLPAVSVLDRNNKGSRKTPGKGVPTPGPSLLSALVGTGDVPPVRRDAPGPPPGPRRAHAPSHGNLPLAPPPETYPTPGPAAAGTGLPAAVRNAPDPFSPLPSGQPAMTLTRQLQAMEIDEIPDRFKIANKKPRWLFRLGLVVLLVGAGVGVGHGRVLRRRRRPRGHPGRSQQSGRSPGHHRRSSPVADHTGSLPRSGDGSNLQTDIHPRGLQDAREERRHRRPGRRSPGVSRTGALDRDPDRRERSQGRDHRDRWQGIRHGAETSHRTGPKKGDHAGVANVGLSNSSRVAGLERRPRINAPNPTPQTLTIELLPTFSRSRIGCMW